jgi:hypothetical protein
MASQQYGDYARQLLESAFSSPAYSPQIGSGSQWPVIAAAHPGHGYLTNALTPDGNAGQPSSTMAPGQPAQRASIRVKDAPGPTLPPGAQSPQGDQPVTLDAINKARSGGAPFTLEDLDKLLREFLGPRPAY